MCDQKNVLKSKLTNPNPNPNPNPKNTYEFHMNSCV